MELNYKIGDLVAIHNIIGYKISEALHPFYRLTPNLDLYPDTLDYFICNFTIHTSNIKPDIQFRPLHARNN